MQAIGSLTTLAMLAAMLLAACWYDVTAHRVPNWVTFGGAIVGLALAVLPGGVGWNSALAGCAIGFGVVLPLYLLRIMGAADVKLMAAVGALLGYPAALGAVLATFLTGGILALAWAVRRGGVRIVLQHLRAGLYTALARVAGGGLPQAADLPATSAHMPYALAVAAGTMVYLALGSDFKWALGF